MGQRLNRGNRRSCIVYGLYDVNNNLRYIGQTRLTIEGRKKWFYIGLKKAIKRGERLSRVDRWIQAGNQFDIRVIEENATWDVSEIIHIDRFKRAGVQLLNVVRGGNDCIHGLRDSVEVIPDVQTNIQITEIVNHKFDGKYLFDEFVRYFNNQSFFGGMGRIQQDDLIWDLVGIVENTK